MHVNKVRPFVKRALVDQKNRDEFDRVPDFEVHKTQERKTGAAASTEAFRVDIKGFMRDTSAYDVNTTDLRDRLNARLPATFCITKPF